MKGVEPSYLSASSFEPDVYAVPPHRYIFLGTPTKNRTQVKGVGILHVTTTP